MFPYSIHYLIKATYFLCKIETLYNCENSLNPYEFNLESIANQIKIHSNDEVLFFSNSNDFLSNQNSVSGNFITQNKYTTLFVKVTDPITNCSDSFTIQLIVELAPLCSTISESKICIDNLNDFRLDIPLELFKEKFDYVIDETLYEVKIYNSLSNAENDLNPLENSLILTNNNYLQNVNLFFRIKNLISECITICPTNILLENYSQTNKKYEFEIKDFSSNNSIVVLVNNTDNLLFSIDGINFSPNNNFENLSPGPYNLTVKDFSVCEYSSQSLYVLNYPKFFTPNNDGFNDVWKVSFSHLEQDLKTEIYDRYGKLLKIMTSNESWDGNNNGFDLPSDDYWFYVIRNDSRIFKGHFTLRR
jgi:gliding motility-associated-like protein